MATPPDAALQRLGQIKGTGDDRALFLKLGAAEVLEAAYRTLLPVIEIDGVRAFTYFVTVEALLDRIGQDGSPARRSTSAGSM